MTSSLDERKEVKSMVKNVFSKIRKLVPVALVVCGWIAFIVGVLVTDPYLKIALLALSRVLP